MGPEQSPILATPQEWPWLPMSFRRGLVKEQTSIASSQCLIIILLLSSLSTCILVSSGIGRSDEHLIFKFAVLDFRLQRRKGSTPLVCSFSFQAWPWILCNTVCLSLQQVQVKYLKIICPLNSCLVVWRDEIHLPLISPNRHSSCRHGWNI